MPSPNRERLIALLRELLQLNQPDLDFGLYRIMNARAAEIEQFLAEDLLRIVEDAFAGSAEERTQEAKAAYEQERQNAAKYGAPDPDAVPAVQEAKAAYDAALAAGGDEADVYDHLYRFFERYYDEGDFLSRRYYARETADRAAPYAVPYDGSEVYFHWANKDQYYIKTTENFRAFTFDAASAVDDEQQRLFADAEAPLRVHLHVVDAAEGEHNNVKADEGKDRFYVIDETPIEWEGDELVVRFQYRHDPEKGRSHAGKWRETRNEEAVEAVLGALCEDEHPQAAAYRRVLTREVRRGKDGQQPLLLRYLTRFTARNTMDYFIHKDLGGFLRRELDFYVKNEVMRLDDLEAAGAPRVESYLAKVRVLRRIAHAVIDFLAQTEDFQKRLWLKKKFVVETQYCLTLDRVPEALYAEIAANDAQREEWVRLFAIDEIEQDLTRPGYSAPLTVDFLKANPFLVLDTALFGEDFKARLLAEVENLDEQCDGVLIHSENSQALMLGEALLANSVDATYIDPPYNTPHSKIAYKNSYEHSSWLSLINNTLPLLRDLWSDRFSFGLAIDDYEYTRLSALLDSTFPDLEKSTVVVNHHPQGAGGRLSRTHEYYILLSRPDAPSYHGAPKEDEEEQRSFMRSGTAENNYRYGRWKSFYALLVDPESREIVGAEEPVPLGEPYPTGPTEEGLLRVYPINSQDEERVWRSSYETGLRRAKNGELIITRKGTIYQLIDHEGKRETLFSNWTDSAFNAGVHGTNVLADLGLAGIFDYPKSINTMETGLWAQTFGRPDALILDYFAGSGTTGHAVVNINREHEAELNYVLVDIGHYFDTVLKPRIQKAVYSKDWKDGKPVGREGVSHCFKYLRLESYEDTLNNLVLADDEAARQRQRAIADSAGLRHDYWLRYWLDLETRGSQSLLSAEHFTDPDGYWLTVKRPGSDEQTPRRVDLIETFNWLLGLHVVRLHAPETFAPEFARPEDPELPGEDNTRLAVKGALEPAEEGPWRLRALEGWVAKTPGSDVERRTVLVVWRTLTGDVEQDDAVLEAYLRERLSIDLERADGSPYEVIYVNGSPTLPKGQGVEVRPLEPEFHRRMWDTQDA